MFERKDTFIPSLKVGQIIRDDRYAYKILGIKRQNSNEIVYDAYGEITYDFPPRRTRIEVVEYVSEEYENRKYESIHYPQNYGFIRDELENSIEVAIGTSSFIVDDKRFYCQLSYDVRKLKIGDSLYLSKKQYVVNNVCGHGSYGEILKLRCVSYSYRNKLKQWFTRSKRSNDCLALKQFQMSQSIELQSMVVLEESAMNSFVLGYEAMSQLSHPNIVEVYDFYFKSRIPCFTMEYIDGLNLRQLVERNGCLPLNEAKEIYQTISKTIEYCHDKGICHGDLKPNNVMITDNGIIKLIDIAGEGRCPDEFGIARIYFYLLTGIYIELPQKRKISKQQIEMFVEELGKKKIPVKDMSHILNMLENGLNIPFPK